ncbi:hypothetical protein RHGRI_014822 [Rhododendron griersonianum]|uniref:Uncharacterized protein n=1 Tax=Rhododendron griersonianum TaxID=479676 RepID=A0AAV6KAY2_9ERIC|nr:hypothetical protein RHGRI_014822 [Rhododendron griersonianum]
MDEQPDVQGPEVWVSTERGAPNSPIEYTDVSAYCLSLSEDTKALNQLNTLIHEGKDMASVFYTYRSCVKALPQLAVDMQCFSRPERRINGPTITHLCTFTQVSMQWQDNDSLREELDGLQIFLSTRWAILLNLHVEMFRVNKGNDEEMAVVRGGAVDDGIDVKDILLVLIVFAVESLELDFALLLPERHILLWVLPVLVVLATSSEKDTTPTAGHRVHTAAATCDPPVNCMSSFPPTALFPVTMQTLSTAIEWCKEVKGNMYDIVEGFQLLSKWTARIWKQCAWKFSRPFKDAVPNMSHEMTTSSSDYEKVVQYNYSSEERKALVELVSYIKSVGSMMQRCDTLVANAVWETIHAEVQDFVQNTLATMLRTTFRKKDLSRVLPICAHFQWTGWQIQANLNLRYNPYNMEVKKAKGTSFI